MVVVLVSILFFSSLVFADEPPEWDEFETTSANGKYTAEVEIKTKDEMTNPWEWQYKLNIYETGMVQKETMWSCDYHYDGYHGYTLLSDDGSTFIYINQWYYSEDPGVMIYRNGQKNSELKGRAFKIDPSKLTQTVSHQLWLNEDEPKYRLISSENLRLELEIITIDKKHHIIDVASGKIIE